MTPEERLLDNLIDMEEAAAEAIGFLDGVSFEAFENDLLRQRAVAMTFVLIAAAAARIQARFPDIASEQPEIAWAQMRWGCVILWSINMTGWIGVRSGIRCSVTFRNWFARSTNSAIRISRENNPFAHRSPHPSPDGIRLRALR